jgi:hypothetical protein
MKLYLDRRNCNSWAAACETCFSWHYMRDEVEPNYCLYDLVDDGRPERTFYIKDRDGVDKILVVDENNWQDVYEGWILDWEKEHLELPEEPAVN